MESRAKRLIQSIILGVFFLSCFLFLRGELTYGEIRALAYAEFTPRSTGEFWLPGLARLMYNTDSLNVFNGTVIQSTLQGSTFELESALYVKAHGQPILGFDLDISFERGKITFEHEGMPITIKTTEFDVVTPRFLLEVKSSCNSDGIRQPPGGGEASVAPIDPYVLTYQNKQMAQFRKERLVIWWMGALKKDLDAGVLYVGVGSGTHRPLITICGPATGGTPITFTSSWICGPSVSECKKQLEYVVNCLANKIFFVFFKHAAPQMVALLKQENFIAKDNVSLEECVIKAPDGLQLTLVS